MSNGTAAHALSSVEPHATISAQDLIQGNPDRCGFLRKRGQKERMLENLHLSKHINWRQRFVVVQDGCCYCFSDEVAKSPHQAFSLRGYYRSSSERAAFVFTMEPASSSGKKFQTFAASSDDDRVAWMQTFKDAMFKANDVVQPSQRPTSKCIDDKYDELEIAVFEPVERTPLKTGHITADREDSYGDDDYYDRESSDDSDYDQPDDDLINTIREGTNRRNLPLPPVPQQGNSDKTDSPSQHLHGRPEGRKLAGSKPIFPTGHHREAEPVPKPKPANPRTREPEPLPKSKPSPHRNREAATLPTPTKESPPGVTHREKHLPPPPSNLAKSGPRVPEKPVRRLSERDCFFDNNDRDAAIEILRDKQVPGTFLIRKSRQGDSKVLVVMTTEDVKEYKIFTDNNGVSLDKKNYFSTVDDLLENYNSSPLPNRQQTLSRSFSASFSKH